MHIPEVDSRGGMPFIREVPTTDCTQPVRMTRYFGKGGDRTWPESLTRFGINSAASFSQTFFSFLFVLLSGEMASEPIG